MCPLRDSTALLWAVYGRRQNVGIYLSELMEPVTQFLSGYFKMSPYEMHLWAGLFND